MLAVHSRFASDSFLFVLVAFHAASYHHLLRLTRARSLLTLHGKRLRAALSGGLLALSALATGASAQTESDVSIIPRPASITLGQGAFVLTRHTVVWAHPTDGVVTRRFARELAAPTGFHLTVRLGSPTDGSSIVFARADPGDTTLGPEGYRLDVKPSGVIITSLESGRRVLRHARHPATSASDDLAPDARVARKVEHAGGHDRRPAAISLAWDAPRRRAAFHPQAPFGSTAFLTSSVLGATSRS